MLHADLSVTLLTEMYFVKITEPINTRTGLYRIKSREHANKSNLHISCVYVLVLINYLHNYLSMCVCD